MMFLLGQAMCDKIWILEFHWDCGYDGSGMYILGVFTTEDLAEKAQATFLSANTLSDESYNLEHLEINSYDLNDIKDWENQCES